MSMITNLEAACANYGKRIEDLVQRAAEPGGEDINPGTIAGLYRDLAAMTTDLYQRRQHAEQLRKLAEIEAEPLPQEQDADGE